MKHTSSTVTRLALCGLLGSLLYAGASLAENPNYRGNQSEWDTFAGIDFKQSWSKATANWQPLLSTSSSGVGLYAGQRVHPFIAWELGYGFSIPKTKKTLVSNGASLLGVSNTDGVTSTVQGKLHLKTAYADLNFLVPLVSTLENSPELLLSLGVGVIKPALTLSILNPTPSSLSSLESLNTSTKAVARFGLGLQSFVLGDVGMRLMWRFENTGALRIGNTVDPSFASFLRNGQSVSLGLFMRL